jgi:hypothetical protein
MKGKTLIVTIIIALLTFGLGWLIRELQSYPRNIKRSGYSRVLLGRFLIKESNCAGFTFIGKGKVLWTNEIACNYPDTLTLRWLNKTTFMTKSIERTNEICPPRVNIYEVISFDSNRLVLKDIWTGWKEAKDETMEFVKKDK